MRVQASSLSSQADAPFEVGLCKKAAKAMADIQYQSHYAWHQHRTFRRYLFVECGVNKPAGLRFLYPPSSHRCRVTNSGMGLARRKEKGAWNTLELSTRRPQLSLPGSFLHSSRGNLAVYFPLNRQRASFPAQPLASRELACAHSR